MRKVSEHAPNRSTFYAIGVAIGVLAGFFDSRLVIDMSSSGSILVWLPAAILVVVVLHEATHGAVAILLGHRPSFGLKPPFVYTTFTGKLSRGHYMLVTIAPFIILNLLFGFLYAGGVFKLFCHLSLIINSIGSAGDIWFVLKLAGAPRDALIQDTKSGFEVWVSEDREGGADQSSCYHERQVRSAASGPEMISSRSNQNENGVTHT